MKKRIARLKRLRPGDIIIPLLLILVTFIVVLPFYYIVVSTFKTRPESLLNPMGLPAGLYLENYAKAIETMNYANTLKNNVIVTVCAVFFIVLLASMAAYPLARKTNKFNRGVYLFFLMGIMIPYQVLLFPLFRIVSGLGLINSLPGLIIVMIAHNLPFSIFLITGFIKTIPYELEEAAWIDGCSPARTFFQVTLPLLKPVIATIVILDALSTWNDFITPMLFIQSRENSVLSLEVFRNLGQYTADYFAMLPMLVLTVLPVLILYIFLQKYIIKGIVSGSLKG